MTRLIRLVGGIALLALCMGGLIDLVAHIRGADSTAAVLIAVLAFLVVLAFAMLAVFMIVAGLSRSDRPGRKR